MTKSRAAEKRVGTLFTDCCGMASDADEDVNGWDLYVEFPPPIYEGTAEDRPAIRKAYLQVKSTEGHSNGAKIKLSNVQIATTSLDPWFILRAYPNEQYRIVHVWGDLLLNWIKALRLASKAGKPLHKETLWVTFDGPKIPGKNLVESLDHIISGVGERYVDSKRELIEQLRHREGAGIGVFTLDAPSHHQRANIMLGLEKKAPARNVHFTRAQFGIPEDEPVEPPSDALITIEPVPIASCEIRFYENNARFLSLIGEVRAYKPSRSPVEKTYFRFSAPAIDIVLRPDGTIFSRLGLEKGTEHPFQTLENCACIGTALEAGNVKIDVSQGGSRTFLSTNIFKNDRTVAAYRCIKTLVQIARSCGNVSAHYTTQQIEAALPKLHVLSQLISKGSIRAQFDLTGEIKRFDMLAYWFDIVVGNEVYYGFASSKVQHQTSENGRQTVYVIVSNVPEIFLCRDASTFNRKLVEEEFEYYHASSEHDLEAVSFGNIFDALREQLD